MYDIYGWFSKKDQIEISNLLSKYNHSDCVGVEIGSLHGKSSYAISTSIDKGKLYCIDMWNGSETYNPDYTNERLEKLKFPGPGMKNTLELFLENTKDRNNIITIQGSSPAIVKDWDTPIDFIFLDAQHENPSDRENIDFWLPKIKSGGMFIGHDLYETFAFPDVNLNVEYMEDLLKQKVSILPRTSIWYFNI